MYYNTSSVVYKHAMTIMSSVARPCGLCTLHAVIFMLREVDLRVPVMLSVDLSLTGVVQH